MNIAGCHKFVLTKFLESGNNEFGLAYNISEKMIFYRGQSKRYLEAKKLIRLPNGGSYAPEIGIATVSLVSS